MPEELLPCNHVPERDSKRHVGHEDDRNQSGKGWSFEDREWHDGFLRKLALPGKKCNEGQDRERCNNNDIWDFPSDRRCLAVRGVSNWTVEPMTVTYFQAKLNNTRALNPSKAPI